MSYITDIDYVRALIEHKIGDNTNYVCGSFYMSAKTENIARYVEKMQDILNDKNRATYRAKVLITNSGTAEVQNMYSKYICSFDFNVRFDFLEINKETIDDLAVYLIDSLKGRKFDIIHETDGAVYVTEPNDGVGVYNGDMIKFTTTQNFATLVDLAPIFTAQSLTNHLVQGDTLYVLNGTEIKVLAITSVGTTITFTVADTITSWKQRKVSLSFSSYESSLPYTLVGKQQVQSFISGQATVCDETCELGNDLIKLEISYDNLTYYTVEQMASPASADVKSENWQTVNTGKRQKSMTTGVGIKRSYDFVVGTDTVTKDLAHYARFGTFITSSLNDNTTYYIKETYSSFGVVTIESFQVKLDDTQCRNTNGDVMTVTADFRLEASGA